MLHNYLLRHHQGFKSFCWLWLFHVTLNYFLNVIILPFWPWPLRMLRLCTQRSQRVLWARGLLGSLGRNLRAAAGLRSFFKKKTQLGQTAEERLKEKEAETMKEEVKKEPLLLLLRRVWAYIHKAKLRERGKAITARRGTTTAAAASASVGLLLGSWRRENAASRLTNLSFLERVIEWWCTIRKQPSWFLKGLHWPLLGRQQK